MRITGGIHRSRLLAVPQGHDVRPTTDKVRQAIFNMLVSYGLPGEDTVVLDGFCGTGALGLEALSRGAARAYFIDESKTSLSFCRKNIGSLGLDDRADVIQCNLLKLVEMKTTQSAAHLVFLDPPYRKDLAVPALAVVAAKGWLAPQALCVIETEKEESLILPPEFENLSRRVYGETAITFCRYAPIKPE